MSTFDRVAEDDRFQFLGNVTVGGQPGSGVTVDELKQHYDALLFSYGASEDRRLGVPNEDAYGVDSARAFVAWYNGLPGFENLKLPLDDTDTAVVIGQGNVALDCARILLSPIDALRKTDITEYALEALSKSRIRHVHVVGRRGPVQVNRKRRWRCPLHEAVCILVQVVDSSSISCGRRLSRPKNFVSR